MSDVSKVIDSLLSEADQHDARSIKIREAVEAIRSVSLIAAVDAPKPHFGGKLLNPLPMPKKGRKGKRKYTKRSAFWKKKK